MKYRRRWQTEGIANLRDLGGYSCKSGITKWGIFYRSTHLNAASPQDLELLERLNIKTVIDLRYPDEVISMPDSLPNSVRYVPVSLMGPTTIDQITVLDKTANTRTLIRMYSQIIKYSGRQIVDIIKCLSDCDGAALIHCAAGKDRTGVIVMFLLAITGVEREDIVADYEISRGYIQQFTADISGSHWSNMDKLIDMLQKKYGGIEGYLQQQGLRKFYLKKLKEKFIEYDFTGEAQSRGMTI